MSIPEFEKKPRKKKQKPLIWDSITTKFPNLQGQNDLERDLPKKWEKHGNLILLPQNCFTRTEWKDIDQQSLWTVVAKHFNVERVAKKGRIHDDGHRTPQVTLVRGEDSWVCHVDNKIKYSYDVTKCMFSIGNITEKIRMAKLDCEDEVIVDMFAGIGYFTLPLLVHGKARYVHACEWNSDAVLALKKNLVNNKVNDRCTVYEGDNRKICPENIADRVIMGLIPTPMASMEAACKALKIDQGGIMHIHHNVDSKIGSEINTISFENIEEKDISCNKALVLPEWIIFAKETAKIVKETMLNVHKDKHLYAKVETEILHIEKVKSYAPHIDHLVLDLKVIVTLGDS